MMKNIIKNKKGLTLVETLVAIGIFSIGITGFSMLFVNAWKTNHYTFEMGQSASAVSVGLNRMVSYLRGIRQSDNGAYPVVLADDYELTVYADYDRDNVTERLHFYYNDGTVYMGIREPSGTMPKTYASGDETTQVIASHIVNDESEPLFYYYNNNYPIDTVNNPVATPASVAELRLMEINLKINIDLSRAPDNIEMRSFVRFRNLAD